MGLVLYALKNRITFYVMGLLILLAGIGTSAIAPKDVLPAVDIPVVVIVWTYTGLDTTDMAQRITTYSEFSLSNNVNDIKQMESQTLPGVAIERIFFQDSVSIDLAIAQVVSAMNSIRAVMPTGVQPPVVMRFSASSVPVIQLALSSATESQAKLYDYGQYRIRQTLTQVPGLDPAVALWRRAAPGHGRPRPPRAAGPRPDAAPTSPTPSRRRTSWCRRACRRSASSNIRSGST